MLQLTASAQLKDRGKSKVHIYVTFFWGFLFFSLLYLKQKRSDGDASGEFVSPGKLGAAS